MRAIKNLARDLLSRLVARLPPGILTDLEFADRYEARGWHATAADSYGLVPIKSELLNLWDGPRRVSDMPGVKMPLEPQLELLKKIRPYFSEYDGSQRGEFPAPDAVILYGMVRHLKPTRIIEIGSGGSTHVSAMAMSKNGVGRITAIDPEPRQDVRDVLRTWGEWIPSRVETVDLAVYQELEAGDILFIDSSHTVRLGGDVTHEFCEIIPRLKPGVIVHVHDIYLPLHYPKARVLGRGMFWTEQYLLQAFLAFNDHWRVMWSAGTIHHKAPDALVSFVPTYDKKCDPDAGSLWMVRV